ncbi:MAG: hypothetical protein JNM21_14985 [Taibaiella sp.]|nr:hypothetical protein [Taibaiella sp.]
MEKNITILSFGAGQDSTAILYRIALDKTFRDQYLKGKLIVLMADTGNEHPGTYQHVEFVKSFCESHSIEFYLITSCQGYHPKNWDSLQYNFQAHNTVMSVAFPKTCTDNLKIKPLYNFLDHYIARHYYSYDEPHRPKGKRYIKHFCKRYGKIHVLLGIAAGEESRIAKPSNEVDIFGNLIITNATWMDHCLQKVYPLVDLQMDRSACQTYIRSTGLPLPPPSNCMMCPFLSKQEILWLYRNYPEVFYEWQAYEQAKLNKFSNANIKSNLGVKGNITLAEFLAQAIAEFGHWTDEQLNEYKMSHGHCVKSAY